MKTVSVLLLLLGATPKGEVIELTGDYCVYCQQMEPTIHRLQREGLPIRQINVQREPEEARRFAYEGLPTFLVVVEGKVLSRTTGAVSESELRRLVSKIPAETAASAPTAPAISPRPSSPNVRVDLGEPQPQPRPAAGLGVVAEVAPTRTTEDSEASVFPKLFRRQPKPEPAARGQSPGAAVAADQRADSALAASVRLHLHGAKGILQGSGTIIDSRVGKTIVITAGAPFAQLPPGSKIEVDVPPSAAAMAAGETRPRTYVAKLVKADLDADVALVEFPTDQPLPRATIAPAASAPKLGDRAACIGGATGSAITRDQVSVTALNKYVGPDTIECSGVPLPGRCGGGLFNRNDELIGVCIAVSEDPKSKAPVGGMYCGLKPIHDLLRNQNLGTLLDPPAMAPSGTAALQDNNLLAMAEANLGSARPMPADPAGMAPASDPVKSAFASDALSNVQPAIGLEPTGTMNSLAAEDDQEVIVIMRSKKAPGAPTRVIHIHRASPKLRALLEGPTASVAPTLTRGATTSGGVPVNPPPLAAR